MRHLGRRGMSVGEVAGTGQNETRGLSDVGEDGVMKALRTSDGRGSLDTCPAQ